MVGQKLLDAPRGAVGAPGRRAEYRSLAGNLQRCRLEERRRLTRYRPLPDLTLKLGQLIGRRRALVAKHTHDA
jgi:hypothetical protein